MTRPLATLTHREAQAARLVASGLARKEAAQQMHVTTYTIDMHLTHVYRKLGIQGGLVELVHYALSRGWVQNKFLAGAAAGLVAFLL